MASYADVAAKGPRQSDADLTQASVPPTHRVPDTVPEILHSDSGVHSLDSLSGPGSNSTTFSTYSSTGSTSNNSIPSYAEQQLESERAQAAREAGEREADEAAIWARQFEQHAEEELAKWEKEHGKSYRDFSADAREGYEKWKRNAAREFEELKKNAKKGGKKAEKEAKKAEQWADKNKENPVVVGNVVVLAAIAGALSFGAYRLHSQGRLTAKVAGLWAGAIGLFAVGDYYFSQFLFKKYPPKN